MHCNEDSKYNHGNEDLAMWVYNPEGGGGYFIHYWAGMLCTAGNLKPLAYTRPHLDAFCNR